MLTVSFTEESMKELVLLMLMLIVWDFRGQANNELIITLQELNAKGNNYNTILVNHLRESLYY